MSSTTNLHETVASLRGEVCKFKNVIFADADNADSECLAEAIETTRELIRTLQDAEQALSHDFAQPWRSERMQPNT